MAKHVRRRRRDSPELTTDSSEDVPELDGTTQSLSGAGHSETSEDRSTQAGAQAPDSGAGESTWSAVVPAPEEDWFGPSELSEQSEAARRDVSLASMLMLGTSSYQRIDGMGLARKALEVTPTGDPRQDLSTEERAMLANARAWCLLVHGDLGHRSRLDDPFVLADAERHVALARGVAPGSPYVETTEALLRFRQGRAGEAVESAQRAMEAFSRIPDHDRTGTTQGGAIMAVLMLALLAAASGDVHGARVLGTAARAVRTPLDIDDAAFTALLSELDEAIARLHVNGADPS
ncbi:MAG TPA: hypothetical protein VMF35_06105 [Acidimicrobiales bacterium]|nr:hypothetical protein [Acidimicrobiales bacterium]